MWFWVVSRLTLGGFGGLEIDGNWRIVGEVGLQIFGLIIWS
jgi:hypothetical protein